MTHSISKNTITCLPLTVHGQIGSFLADEPETLIALSKICRNMPKIGDLWPHVMKGLQALFFTQDDRCCDRYVWKRLVIAPAMEETYREVRRNLDNSQVPHAPIDIARIQELVSEQLFNLYRAPGIPTLKIIFFDRRIQPHLNQNGSFQTTLAKVSNIVGLTIDAVYPLRQRRLDLSVRDYSGSPLGSSEADENDFYRQQISPLLLNPISLFPLFPKLRELSLFGAPSLLGTPQTPNYNDQMLDTLARTCPSLEEIDLESCEHITDKGISLLSLNCPLKTISLCACSVTDVGLKALASAPQISGLYLSSLVRVTEDGLQELAGLKTLTSLELDNLEGITRDVSHIFNSLKQLQNLSLQGQLGRAEVSTISDRFLDAVLKIETLRVLNLGFTGSITFPRLLRFYREASKDLEILPERGPGSWSAVQR